MRTGLFTLSLAVALPACSKLNPLFFDTWEGSTEGASQVDTGATSGEPGTTATNSDVPTTAVPTSTGEPGTTVGPTASSEPVTSTGSTGPGCMSQAIEPIAPADDTFLVFAKDGGAGEKCILGAFAESFTGYCHHLDFGKQPSLSLFRGPDPVEMPKERIGAFIVDFPRDPEGTGQLTQGLGGAVVPFQALEQVVLRVAYSNPDNVPFDAVTVDVYAIPAELDGIANTWFEGPEDGKPCTSGANFLCSRCGQLGPPNCDVDWFGKPEVDLADFIYIATHELPGVGEEGMTQDIPIAPKWFGLEANRGFLIVPQAMKVNDEVVEAIPGPMRMHSKEFPDPLLRPALRVHACLP